MWITEHLELPDELLDASLAGELVVFAGAGVSMGAPARLPSFLGLAGRIGRESGQPLPQEAEPLDVYLGRLQQLGVPVRDRARKILHRPRGHPTPLHKSLIGIFGPKVPMRIVTTNFDLLFERAAKKLGRIVEIFNAPALPVGDNFSGIVHLHGSFAKEDLGSLVITDRDFGAAYITEGWAARFLVSAFSKFKVVFVGYSLADPVMRYLAAALPPETPRYALIADNVNRDDWRMRQIQPITYPATSDHGNLLTSVEAWATHAQSGFLEHERQIQQIVETGIPLEPAKRDYLLRMLSRSRTAEFFTRYARQADWLAWVADQELLDCIFNPAATLSDVDYYLLRWYTNYFALDHADAALRVLQQHGTRMHPTLWRHIAGRLRTVEPGTAPRVMSRWLSALEGGLSDVSAAEALSSLLVAEPERLTVQQRLRVFTFLTRPQATLEAPVIWTDREAQSTTRGSADLLGDAYYLGEGWQKLRAEISEIADAACVDLIVNLRSLTRIALDLDDEKFFDYLSWDRSAIEPHPQDAMGLTEGWGVLVTAIRDCLEHITSPGLTRGIVGLLIRERSLLAQRLAVHAMAMLPDATADEKLAWLLDVVTIYQFGLKHEIFRLFQLAWPDASAAMKDRVLGIARDNMDADDEPSQYEIYNLLYWLSSLEPPHQGAIDALASFQRNHPAFEPRENPDFDHWMSAGFGSYMRGSQARQLSGNPNDVVRELVRLPTSEPEYVELVQQAASSAADDQAWALGLLGSMTAEECWIAELWSAALSGLAINRPSEPALWPNLFTALTAFPYKNLIARDVGRLLVASSRDDSGSIDEELLPAALHLIGQYWTAAMDADRDPAVTTADWLGQANATGEGILLLGLLTICSQQWRLAGGGWRGLPQEATQLMSRINTEHGRAGQLARAMVGSQVAFLQAADDAWTQATVLPWFMRTSPPEESAATWDGFLVWGQWNERLIPRLGQELAGLLPLVRAHMPDRLKRYIDHLVSLYVDGSSPILTPAWLDPFFAHASGPDRVAWADGILRRLSREPPAAAMFLWQSRLSPLLTRRLDRIPLPLTPEELSVMGAWIARAGAIAEPVLDLLITAGKPSTADDLLIRDVAENESLGASPTAGARLLTWLLSGMESTPWFCNELAAAAIRLHDRSATKLELLKLCEQLARLGCPQAQDLQARFNAKE